jgi:branched-chain amino acid transport system substrate-binding protein
VGLTKARKLVERDGVHLISGIVSSAVGFAVKSYVDAKQVPLVLLISGTDDITMKNRSPYIFRILESVVQQAYPFGQWVAQKRGYKRALIVTSNFVTGLVQAEAFAKGFVEAGGQVVDRG